MSTADIQGSNHLPPWLQRQVAHLMQHRGHALLLSGPSGLGQYPLALGLASAWLCESPTPQGACGQCESCHAVAVRTHPDLRVLMPDTLAMELNWPLDERTLERIEKKEIKPSRWIRVEAAREAVAFTQYTRSRGRTKVVLIHPAERMNTEAANTLLKTLEEPVGAVRFVLTSEASHQLLPTLRSRCQNHALDWPAQDEAVRWLQQVTGAPAEQVQIWLLAAGGRPDDALAWAQLGLTPAVWQGLARALQRGDWRDLAAWPPAVQLEVQQKLCHDLLVSRWGGRPRYFVADSLPPSPAAEALGAWWRELAASARTVEHPFNAGLMAEAWAARCRDLWAPAHGAPGRAVPLRALSGAAS